MKYMVIESFKPGMSEAVYDRFQARGRMLPDGLEYVDSWLSADRSKCFQLMQTDTFQLFDIWTALWGDLIDFEIVEVVESPTKITKQI
jgi:hypothetical protein